MSSTGVKLCNGVGSVLLSGYWGGVGLQLRCRSLGIGVALRLAVDCGGPGPG